MSTAAALTDLDRQHVATMRAHLSAQQRAQDRRYRRNRPADPKRQEAARKHAEYLERQYDRAARKHRNEDLRRWARLHLWKRCHNGRNATEEELDGLGLEPVRPRRGRPEYRAEVGRAD